MLNVALNNELNGIELCFDKKPDESVLAKIRDNGFRWSMKKRIWYAKQTNERLAFVKTLDENAVATEPKHVDVKPAYDLWKITRTDEIGNNYEKYHIRDNKEIAAIIRKHLRERFPMCKWSVRIGGNNSIYVTLLESPFEKDSDELKAIAHYAYTFGESYNYDNSDIYSDYFDVNFYGLYESEIIGYDYHQREATVAEARMSEEFKTTKREFDEADELRKAKEYDEYCKAEEERRKQEVIDAAHRTADKAYIEEHAEVTDVEPYFVLDCVDTGNSKLNEVSEYKESEILDLSRHNCLVSREVRVSIDVYEKFTVNLLQNFSFLENMGGSRTDDLRVKSTVDFSEMDALERDTVEWYSADCVAIILTKDGDSEIKFIVDPSGFSYARYVYFVDDETVIKGEYKPVQTIDSAELAENERIAALVAQDDINVRRELALENPDTEDFTEYRHGMTDRIISNGYRFDKSIIRAVDDTSMKSRLYRLLTVTDGIQEQFSHADLTDGQKLTLVRIGEFGMLNVIKVTFRYVEFGKYAQYDDVVKFVVREGNKSRDMYVWLYNDVLIYDGWQDLPEELFWEIEIDGAVTTRHTRYLSSDRTQYDVVMEYLKDNGIRPLINTYKPLF